MRKNPFVRKHSGQRGQTIVLVALFISILVMMAALAIDTTTLYVAHDETQRAADAAALAGAKAFVDSGVTTGAKSGDEGDLQGLATIMATAFIRAVVAQDKVQGVAPTIISATPDYSRLGNPQITVTLQRTSLPTFFARIFGQRAATVTASATAEAYNSSNTTGASGTMPPVGPSCVKPWLVPNIDYHHGHYDPFVNADGSLAHPGVSPGGVIGEHIGGSTNVMENLLYGVTLPPSLLTLNNILTNTLSGTVGYLPAEVASFSGSCSACGAGGTNFEQSVACCNTAQTYACARNGPSVLTSLLSITDVVDGTACLLGVSAGGGGPKTGLDDIDFTNFFNDQVGPIEIKSGPGRPHSSKLVTTSPQIVTMPIIDTTNPLATLLTGPKIMGYIQAFVTTIDTNDGGITGYILNISGCGTNIDTSAIAIAGGGTSPVPVRLIHN